MKKMRSIKKKKVLICFIGIDGTGKTTLARKLVEVMNEQGIGTKYVWSGLQPGLLRPFIWIGRTFFIPPGDPLARTYISYSTTIRKVTRNPIVRTMYEFVLLLDYARQLLWTIRIPMMRGKSIVSDRYGYDILIDLCVVLGYSDRKMDRTLKAFEHLLPKPSLTFVIDAPEEIALKRKDDIPSISHLSERRQIYLGTAKQYGFVMLDGAATLPELQAKIWTKVREII